MAWTNFLVLSIAIAALAYLCTREPGSQYVEEMLNRIVQVVNDAKTSGSATERLFTKEELKDYDGKTKSDIYLAIAGKVYDVTKGERFYAAGSHYGGFSGKDGTRAFVTGQFNEKGLVEDISDFTPLQMLEILNWQEFYETSYTYIGKLIGHFYDADGNPTDAQRAYESGLAEGQRIRKEQADDRERFPPCNSEWSQEHGSRVWCTTKSGGVKRDWVGLPRKYHKPGEAHTRCACVRSSGPPSDEPDGDSAHGDLRNPNLQEYRGCAPDAASCKLIKED